ncbi:MAG: PEP-CTERM sorting domain-containing protein [Terriglobia bacterium]
MTTSSYGGPNYAGTDFALIERDIDACTGCTPGNYLGASYGVVSNNNLLNPADAGTPPPNDIGDGTYWYQIIRNGGTLGINVSYDGINYTTGISTALTDPSGTYNELLLGGVTYLSAGSYTDYAYVDITTPTATPEPRSLILFGTGLLALAGFCVRRRKVA